MDYYIRMFFFCLILLGLLYLPRIIKNIKISKYRKKILTLKYFNTIQKYYTLIHEDKDLKKIRSIRATLILLSFLMVLFGSIILYFGNLPIGITLLLCGILLYIFKYKGNYDELFKRNIIPLAVKEYNSNFIYSPNAEILELDYDSTWKEQFDIYHSEDKIDGTVNGCPFVVADVHTKYKVENRTRHGVGKNKRYSTYTRYVTGFEGIVVKVKLDIPLNFGLAMINCDTIGINTRPLKYVKMDNQQFSEICKVFSDDEFKTYQFLRPSITNNLIDLYNYYKIPFDIKFSGNYVWFRFKDVKLFKTDIDGIINEAYSIALYFEILEFIQKLLKEMNDSINELNK